MGSFIEINDTLQISKEQWFPEELDVTTHIKNPYSLKSVKGKVFHFHSKSKIRIYHRPPVRNFLVENIDGKWVYWWLVHILEVYHDYLKETTSGSFEIIYLNSPEEMKLAHSIIDRNPETSYF